MAYGCSFTFGAELDDLPKWHTDLTDKRNFIKLSKSIKRRLSIINHPKRVGHM